MTATVRDTTHASVGADHVAFRSIGDGIPDMVFMSNRFGNVEAM